MAGSFEYSVQSKTGKYNLGNHHSGSTAYKFHDFVHKHRSIPGRPSFIKLLFINIMIKDQGLFVPYNVSIIFVIVDFKRVELYEGSIFYLYVLRLF